MGERCSTAGLEARELLMECCTILEHENDCSGVAAAPHAARVERSLRRAEDKVRQAFAEINEDFDNPTLLTVFEAAEVLAKHDAYNHPLFADQLDRFAARCAAS